MMKKLAFILLFAVLVFLSVYVPISRISETSKYFTLYEFLGPLPAAFLGPIYGAIAVIAARGATILTSSSEIGLFDFARIFTMAFATWYFAMYKKENKMLVVPLLAMALFILSPVGAEAWLYSLYWLVPIIAYVLPNNLFFRALGASFMAHAIGSVAFLYTFQTTPQYWLTLIPIVAIERIVFAAGTVISFVVINAVLERFFANEPNLKIEKNYTFGEQISGALSLFKRKY